MRIVATTIAALYIVTLSAGCGSSKGGETAPKEKNPNPYLGTWQGKDQLGQTMTITFEEDGQLLLVVQGRRREFRQRGTWKMDTKPNPAHLEINMRNRMPIRTICKLEGERFVFENINSSERRPTRFGRQRVIMRRQK